VYHPTMLTNPFPHNQNMTSCTSNIRNALGGGQTPSAPDAPHQCMNMVRSEISVAARTRNYSPPHPSLGTDPPLWKNLFKSISLTLCLAFRKDSLRNLLIITMLEPPRITQLSRIWAKHCVQCQL
jgi:hypothetical protein